MAAEGRRGTRLGPSRHVEYSQKASHPGGWTIAGHVDVGVAAAYFRSDDARRAVRERPAEVPLADIVVEVLVARATEDRRAGRRDRPEAAEGLQFVDAEPFAELREEAEEGAHE